MWRENRNLNLEIVQAKELLERNPMVIMRDKYTRKPLGVSFTEEGLRTTANKNGVYVYCKFFFLSGNRVFPAPRGVQEALQACGCVRNTLWASVRIP